MSLEDPVTNINQITTPTAVKIIGHVCKAFTCTANNKKCKSKSKQK